MKGRAWSRGKCRRLTVPASYGDLYLTTVTEITKCFNLQPPKRWENDYYLFPSCSGLEYSIFKLTNTAFQWLMTFSGVSACILLFTCTVNKTKKVNLLWQTVFNSEVTLARQSSSRPHARSMGKWSLDTGGAFLFFSSTLRYCQMKSVFGWLCSVS